MDRRALARRKNPETRPNDSSREAEPANPRSDRSGAEDVQARVRLAEETFRDIYRRSKQGSVPPVAVRFYPYTTLKNTIRLRRGRVFVRLSDILTGAPGLVIASAVAILTFKLLGQNPPPRYTQVYRRYANQDSVLRLSREVRARRGRKQLTDTRGRYYDLDRIFEELNGAYFRGELRVRALSWSQWRSLRTLGHWDPDHEVIIISRSLDRAEIPDYVVRYVVYHEMLHAWLGSENRGGKRYVHTRTFRRAERNFVDYERARWFLDQKLPRKKLD